MSAAQEAKIREFVAKKLEITVGETEKLLGVTPAEAERILDGMTEYVSVKTYGVGGKVYHLPLGPDPRERPDGTRDQGAVADHNVGRKGFVANAGEALREADEPLERFQGRRTMGEG
jgi:hypothetical protein